MRIFYFTNSYPYGPGNSWKEQEIKHLINTGFELFVIPFKCSGIKKYRNLNSSLFVEEPLLEDNSILSLKRKLLSIIFSKQFFYFFSDFIRYGSFKKKDHIISWILASYDTLSLLKQKKTKELLDEPSPDTVFYFYWGLNAAFLIPFLKKKNKKIACRFHGYDLYDERNNGYLPFQSSIVKNCDIIMPCSEHGAKYLKAKYSTYDIKVFVTRLGTISKGLAKMGNDDVFHLISCSSVISVKRVQIIAECLQYINSNIQWTHIGDGDLLESLKSEVASMNLKNIEVNFMGRLPPEKVQEYYVTSPCDLFLNVSEYEGVPVSIMEAFSAGIPAFATDVGGTSEIVDKSVGKLLGKDITPPELAFFIDQYRKLDQKHKMKMRENAFSRFEELCNISENTRRLSEVLKFDSQLKS